MHSEETMMDSRSLLRNGKTSILTSQQKQNDFSWIALSENSQQTFTQMHQSSAKGISFMFYATSPLVLGSNSTSLRTKPVCSPALVQSMSFPLTQHFQHPFKHCQSLLYIQSQTIWLIGVISLIWNISKITKQGIDWKSVPNPSHSYLDGVRSWFDWRL